MIPLIIYLIGCILCYGRSMADFYSIQEDYIDFLPPERFYPKVLAFLSWIGFLAGITLYFIEKDKYFFKWSYKDLWDRYNSTHSQK